MITAAGSLSVRWKCVVGNNLYLISELSWWDVVCTHSRYCWSPVSNTALLEDVQSRRWIHWTLSLTQLVLCLLIWKIRKVTDNSYVLWIYWWYILVFALSMRNYVVLLTCGPGAGSVSWPSLHSLKLFWSNKKGLVTPSLLLSLLTQQRTGQGMSEVNFDIRRIKKVNWWTRKELTINTWHLNPWLLLTGLLWWKNCVQAKVTLIVIFLVVTTNTTAPESSG